MKEYLTFPDGWNWYWHLDYYWCSQLYYTSVHRCHSVPAPEWYMCQIYVGHQCHNFHNRFFFYFAAIYCYQQVKYVGNGKRHAHQKHGKKNKKKRLRLSGKTYDNAKGKHLPARSVKPINCSKCKYKCSEKVNETDRQRIFETLWDLNSHEQQRQYLCQHVFDKLTQGKSNQKKRCGKDIHADQ